MGATGSQLKQASIGFFLHSLRIPFLCVEPLSLPKIDLQRGKHSMKKFRLFLVVLVVMTLLVAATVPAFAGKGNTGKPGKKPKPDKKE